MAEPPNQHHERPQPVRRFVRALISPNSFGSVLVLILITYLMSAVATESWERSLVLFVQVLTVKLALRVAGARRPVQRLANVVLVVAIGVGIANLFGDDGETFAVLVFLTAAFLYFLAPLSILRAIVMQHEVDEETVFGAVAAYLLIGMFFAFVYQAVGAIQEPAAFFQGGIQGTVADSLFFSFTTLTTTGYGNLVPAGNPGQTFAVMEMLIGQLFLVTAVAKVINLWRPARWRAEGGGSDGSPATGADS